MSSVSATAGAEPSRGVRALPPRPNLEFERNAAKKLLRQLRAGIPAAVARAALRSVHATEPAALRLADAQLIVAREYGFASWPRLVEYYRTWDRHARAQPVRATYRADWYIERVRQVHGEHHAKLWSIAPALATWVPRFYAMSDAEVFAQSLSEAEAQLLVARREGFAGWDALMAAAAKVEGRSGPDFLTTPFGMAQTAIEAGDIEAVKASVAAHPELLHETQSGPATGVSIISSALYHEMKTRSAKAREITNWLAAHGADLQLALNRRLVGWIRAPREDFEFLLGRGADPTWLPPNGISILEHVLLRCWDPGPADLIAMLVEPRRAFWIAAGLGDVRAMRRYFDRNGTLTDPARHDRPDFTAVHFPMPQRPGVPDRDLLWEASIVAGFNQRWAALDFLYARGLPIDYSPYRFNLLHWAVGNHIVPVVEFLLDRDADLDLKGWMPHASAREMAKNNFEDNPSDPAVQRIHELCTPS